MEFMTHLFRFFIFFIGFHGWIGRHSCLSDYSRIFADIWPLANGSRPIYAPVVFVTQISQMAQIFLCGDYFVPQISQIYTDFSLWGLFRPTNFTDDADFSLWRLFRPTDFTDIHRFFFVGLFPTSGGICNNRTGRICEICVTKKQIYTDDSPRFYTFYLVISLFNHTFASNFKVVHF